MKELERKELAHMILIPDFFSTDREQVKYDVNSTLKEKC